MNIQLEWKTPLSLGRSPYDNFDLQKIPNNPGIYIFLRKHGRASEALYVGKTMNLRNRIKQQLNNRRLIDGMRNAANGERLLVFAEPRLRRGQQLDRVLDISETALIRYYLAKNARLINIQGVAIRLHELTSTRDRLRNFLPQVTSILAG